MKEEDLTNGYVVYRTSRRNRVEVLGRKSPRHKPQMPGTEAWEASFLKYSIFSGTASDSEVLEGLCSSEGITC